MKAVLIVDDDRISRRIMRYYLEKKDIRIHEAENGEHGLDILKDNADIETVILDLNMPVLDGYEFLTRISQNSSYNHLKIYITSASRSSEFDDKIAKKGISTACIRGYFQKPIMMQELTNTIADN